MTDFPILMYHALTTERPTEQYAVAAESFRGQMQRIANLGKRGVSLDDMALGKAAGETDVVLSFDDGHSSNATLALPILKQFGFTATFFVTTAHVGTNRDWLNWEQLAALRDQGMDLQAHGHTHRFFSELSDAELDQELSLPREAFARRLGHDVRHLSVPGGRFDGRTVLRAGSAGYRSLSSSIPGVNRLSPDRPQAVLKRVLVHQTTSAQQFERVVCRDLKYLRQMAFRYRVKQGIRRLLGNRAYYALWSAANRKGGIADG